MRIRPENYLKVADYVGRGVRTERDIMRATAIPLHRVREICNWLREHDRMSRKWLGTRRDPHDHANFIDIYAYTMLAPVTKQFLIERLRSPIGDTKIFDATALVASWKGA